MTGMFEFATSLLRLIDPERAHGAAITSLKSGLYPRSHAADPDILGQDLFGLRFPNPLGMAAGFDKNGEVADPLLDIGFGFVEIGTVTPRPQTGNPRPRMFRLSEDRAVINRLGFNNDGHARVLANLQGRSARGIVGVNIGANKDAEDRAADYVSGLETFWSVASYFTVNISSPNTPGLRGLQERGPLEDLIGRLMDKRAALAQGGGTKPVLLKIAPDLDEEALGDIAEVCLGAGIDGVIVSNTTISRPPLKSAAAAEQGGLSGAPLFPLSTGILAKFARASGGRLPLVGVGGISSGADAYAKICAGASLVQLYTGMVYEGPGIVARIKRELERLLERDGHARIADAVGTRMHEFANWPREQET